MKHILLATLLVLLTSACASSDNGIIDEQTRECGSGQEIDILAGLQQPGMRERNFGDNRATLIVNVGNNTHDEVTIKNIRVDQIADPYTTYRYDSSSLNPDKTIAEGGEETFELPMTARIVMNPDARTRDDGFRREAVLLSVRVTLSNGDSYVCRYAVPSPM